VRQAISLLLQVDLNPTSCYDEENPTVESEENISISPELFTRIVHPFRYPTVTSQGLPPPSAHQLLQPLLSSAVFPFPHNFTRTYSLLQTLHDYSNMARELSLNFFVSEDENTCVKSEADNKKALFLAKIS
jgi:WD repeat-containing protein 81